MRYVIWNYMSLKKKKKKQNNSSVTLLIKTGEKQSPKALVCVVCGEI